jgi:hypothetical protein
VRVPLAARRTRVPTWVALGLGGSAVVVAAAAALLVATDESGDPTPTTTTTTTACAPLLYQPCGAAAPAANTDGTACLATFEDYDGDPGNGCEAAPDDVADGTELTASIEATIVPRDDVDRFAIVTGDGFQVFCDGRIRLTLTAPEGLSLRLDVFDPDGKRVERATSADGVPTTVELREKDCFRSDAGTYIAEVSAIGTDRTAMPYTLARDGEF